MKNKPDKKPFSDTPRLDDPQAHYAASAPQKLIKDFSYNDFKKIASKTDFTQKEWSDILHVSERTLQRYAKDNPVLSFGITDRVLQVKKVFERGREVFGSYEKFNRWLREEPYMPEGPLSLYSLASFDGISHLLTQIGRIEHGILA
jgi:uncharacterized protein (DUF2384 family)